MNPTYQQLQIELKRLEKKFQSAHDRMQEADRKHVEAQRYFEEESADVDKLESQSLSTFFHSMIGNYDRKLDKEKQEQLEAKIYLDRMTALFLEAREDFQALSEQVQETERRLNVLKRELSLSDDSFREKLTQERQKRLELKDQIKEINEAYKAGQTVLDRLDATLDKLDSADSMATWDLFSDGLFTDLIKYNKIDQAEKELTYLETAIDRYKKELKDVQMESDLTYEELGEMHRFFDIFFDNIFSDWSTKETIGRNIDMLNELYYEVKDIQKTLQSNHRSVTAEIEESEYYY